MTKTLQLIVAPTADPMPRPGRLRRLGWPSAWSGAVTTYFTGPIDWGGFRGHATDGGGQLRTVVLYVADPFQLWGEWTPFIHRATTP